MIQPQQERMCEVATHESMTEFLSDLEEVGAELQGINNAFVPEPVIVVPGDDDDE